MKNNPNRNSKPTMIGAEKWLGRLHKVLETTPVSPKLGNKILAEKLEISERDLFRKIKKLTGVSPQKYIRCYRLQQAMQYFKIGKYRTVKETGHAVGYSNVSYFIAQFEIEFGKRPFQILKEFGWR